MVQSTAIYNKEAFIAKINCNFWISLTDTVDYKIQVHQEDINAVKEQYKVQVPRGSREDVTEVLNQAMYERGLSAPSTAGHAVELYGLLLPVLD